MLKEQTLKKHAIDNSELLTSHGSVRDKNFETGKNTWH